MARVNLTYVFLQIFLTILFVFLYDSCYAFSYPKVLWRALVILTLPTIQIFSKLRSIRYYERHRNHCRINLHRIPPFSTFPAKNKYIEIPLS